jgi:hypothetical protein
MVPVMVPRSLWAKAAIASESKQNSLTGERI